MDSRRRHAVRCDTRVSTSIKPPGENSRVSADKRRPMLDVASLRPLRATAISRPLPTTRSPAILPRTKIAGQLLSSKRHVLADHLRTRSACWRQPCTDFAGPNRIFHFDPPVLHEALKKALYFTFIVTC